MTDLRKAAEMLMKALDDGWVERGDNVVIALRQALAQPEQPMSPEHLPRYVATNGVKPMEGGGGGGSQPEPDWTTDTPVPPFKYLDLPEYKTTQPEQGCAECGVKASDGYALYCVACAEKFVGGYKENVPVHTSELLTQVSTGNHYSGNGTAGVQNKTKPTGFFFQMPPKQWVGLTDEEREQATGWSVEHIEAKLKEKNGA